MQPGFWSGAYVCWGTENREAAVRFIAGGPANPHNGNVEVKVVDRCPGCSENDLDLSPTAFKKLAPLGKGRLKQVKWKMID